MLDLNFSFNNTHFYLICVITKCAETGRAPPAAGVILIAVKLPSGFRTESVEFVDIYCILHGIRASEVNFLP